MQSGFIFEVNADVDQTLEVVVKIASGDTRFAIWTYSSSDELAMLCNQLEKFAISMRSGVVDFQLGKFGQEYANGAFNMRCFIANPGMISIRVRAESEYFPNGNILTADNFVVHMHAVASSLDNFILDLSKILSGEQTSAYFHADSSRVDTR